MRCQFSATIDTSRGCYEIEIHNVDAPQDGVDFEVLCTALHQIMRDMDARMKAAREEADGGVIYVSGDDIPLQ